MASSSLLTAALLGFIYVSVVNHFRFARVNALKRKHGFTKNPKSYEDMTVEQAQQIEWHLAEWEFPWLFEFGWLFAFFQPASTPSLSIITSNSGHFVNKDRRIVHKRQQDTIVLMHAFMAQPLKSEYNSLALARINEHHANFTKINSDTMLYLIWIFWNGPVSWINAFGWRKLEGFEVHALWVFWRELALRMGLKYVPTTLAELDQWVKNYRKEHVYPHRQNNVLANGTLATFIFMMPDALKPMAKEAVYAILDKEILWAVGWDAVPKMPRTIMRPLALGPFRLVGLFHRWLCLPRIHPYVRSTEGANEMGLFNFPSATYPTTPYYVAETFWSQWGPKAIMKRIRGMPIPDAQWYSDGVRWESIGPKRGIEEKQLQAESNVRRQARELMEANWGFRPPVSFQSRPLIKPLSRGYGSSGAEAFPDDIQPYDRKADLDSRVTSINDASA